MSTPEETPPVEIQADTRGPVSYKIGQKVSVACEYATHRDTDRPYHKEFWVAISDNESLFGLVYRSSDTTISHMAYGFDYFKAQETLDWMEEHGHYFYFDAGTTCPMIRIHSFELERAFRELGLLH
jgi:hypothetical protein